MYIHKNVWSPLGGYIATRLPTSSGNKDTIGYLTYSEKIVTKCVVQQRLLPYYCYGLTSVTISCSNAIFIFASNHIYNIYQEMIPFQNIYTIVFHRKDNIYIDLSHCQSQLC